MMYKSFVNTIKCPTCGSINLSVESIRETEDQILEGAINCLVCKMKFPIIDGIPLLIDASKQKEIIKNWNTSSEYGDYTLEATKRVQKLVQDYSRDTMIALDAGCGSGAYTHFFNSKEIICLDLIPFFLKKTMNEYTGNSKLHMVIADVTMLPFKENSVDIIFCSSVLEHLPEREIVHTTTDFFNISKKTVLVDLPNDSNHVVLFFRYIFEKMGLYKGRIQDVVDERLMHHSKFSTSKLEKLSFEVHGCIGWVTRKNIRLGLLWDLYDLFVWICPSLGGTLIGIKKVE